MQHTNGIKSAKSYQKGYQKQLRSLTIVHQYNMIYYPFSLQSKVQDLMKNKGTKGKGAKEKQITIEFDTSWQTLSAIQTSLRKSFNNKNQLPLSQEYFQIMIQSTQQILNAIGVLKNQQKHFQTIQENYNIIQSKLNNHENIISNMEKNHLERMRNISDQNKNTKEYFEKAKRSLQQSEEQAKILAAEAKKQNAELKYRVDFLTKQKQQLTKILEQKNKEISVLKENIKTLKQIQTNTVQQKPTTNKFEDMMCSQVGHRIIGYLNPRQITQIQLLNKNVRIYVIKSKNCQIQLCKSINKIKDRHIKYFHKHIDYFQKLFHKIPEEILQTTFYECQIAKNQVGAEILSIFNSSALLFEGKFTDIEEQIYVNESQLKEQDLQRIKEQEHYLEIDQQIIKQFYEDKKNKKQKLNKEVVLMYKKIQDTAQLYSADVQSIGLFLKNVLKNFSKVFVLSKNLYTQTRNLQSLNTFLLSELSQWDKGQVQKNSLIQDLKAELQAERKLRLFFTEKGIKSEQRALNQENIKLGIQMKFNKQIQKLDEICREREELKTKIESLQNSLKNVQGQNKQIRKAYESGREKYNKIIEELGVVKQTILRMNVM